MSSPALSAKPSQCSQIFRSQEDHHNAAVRKAYRETDKYHFGFQLETFEKAVRHYGALLTGKGQKVDYAIRFFNDSPLTYTVFDRYKLLVDRKIAPQVREKLDKKLSLVQENAQETGPFLSSQEPLSERKKLLLEVLEPQIDDLNVTRKKDAKEWAKATEYLIELIHRKKKFDRRELTSLVLVLQGNHPDHPAASAGFAGPTDVNYMFRIGKGGKKILDPTLSFIPGAVKSEALNDFLKWLEKNEGKMNPIELAAQARTMIVSIHPITDRNGRLARLIANYILMRAGLPPAAIPRGEDGSSSVVLFPLKSYDDQISPEKSYQLMLEGVLRSQKFLLGNKSRIYP